MTPIDWSKIDFSAPFDQNEPEQPAQKTDWSKVDFTAPADDDFEIGPKSLGFAESSRNAIISLLSGAARVPGEIGYVAEALTPKEGVLRDVIDFGREHIPGVASPSEAIQFSKEATDYIENDPGRGIIGKMSEEYKKQRAAGIFDEDFGVNTLVAGAAQSLPETALIMGTSFGQGIVAKKAVGEFLGLAREVGAKSILEQAAKGSVRAQRIVKYAEAAPAVSGAIVGGITEGGLAAGATGLAVEDEVNRMSHDDLIAHGKRYREIYESAEGMEESARREYAKSTAAQEAGRSAALNVGLATAALGAPGVLPLGHLGGKAVKSAAIKTAFNKLESKVTTQALVGFATEAGQEFFQEGSQQFLQNLAVKGYADERREVWDGVFSNAVLGGILGGVTGGTITPILGSGSRQNARDELAKESAGKKSADEDTAAEDRVSRNPILEARIQSARKAVADGNVPPLEYMKVSRWAVSNGGRSALEVARALESLAQNKAAPEEINDDTGGDFHENGILTQTAYEKDRALLNFESELRVTPSTEEEARAVAEVFAKARANPYLMKNGDLVVPASKAGMDTLSSIADDIVKAGGPQARVTEVSNNESSTENPAQAVTPEDVGSQAVAAQEHEAEAQAITKRFSEQLTSAPEKARADYAAIPETNGGQILAVDIARELSPDYLKDRSQSVATHEPSSALIKEIYAERLAAPTPEGRTGRVVMLAGGTGAGKTTGLKTASDEIKRAEIIYDTNLSSEASSVKKIEQALAAGRSVDIVYTFRDPVESLTAGAIKRAERQRNDFGSGRTVPLREHAKTHEGSLATVKALAEKYANDPRVSILVVDNSHGKGKARATSIDKIAALQYNHLEKTLKEALDREYEEGRISDETYRGFAGRSPPAKAVVRDSGQPGGSSPEQGRVAADRGGDRKKPERVNAGRGVTEPSPLEEAGRQSASHPESTAPEPTDAQLEAGNYRKGRATLKGNTARENIPVSIENVPGSKRRSIGRPKWVRIMKHYYGYIRGTTSSDGDAVDAFMGNDAHDPSLPVFVVKQMDAKTGAFDEPKVMLGFKTAGEAKNAYFSEYPKGLGQKQFGGMTTLTREQFADWLESNQTDVPPHPISKAPILSLKKKVEAAPAEDRDLTKDVPSAETIPLFHQRRPRAHSLTVVGVHYTKVGGLESLSGKMAGTGFAGGEQRRFGTGNFGKAAAPGSTARRVLFYEQSDATTPRPENIVAEGRNIYRARLENIYDLSDDPAGIVAELRQSNGIGAGSNLDLIEEELNDRGYDGYILPAQAGMFARPIVVMGLTKNIPVTANYTAAEKKTKNAKVATPAMFRSDLQTALSLPGWGVVTATQESVGAHNDKANLSANKKLLGQIRDKGLKHIPIQGVYKGVDQGQSFIVFADEATIHELGNQHGQESILSNRGLVYSDGSRNPNNTADTVIGDEAKSRDVYSVLPDGTAFSLGLDFSKTLPASEGASFSLRQKKLNVPTMPPRHYLLHGLYSALYEAVQNDPSAPKSGTLSQWQDWIRGAQARGLFRKEEVEWTGAPFGAAGPQAKIPASQVLRQIRESYPAITEEVAGGESIPVMRGILEEYVRDDLENNREYISDRYLNTGVVEVNEGGETLFYVNGKAFEDESEADEYIGTLVDAYIDSEVEGLSSLDDNELVIAFQDRGLDDTLAVRVPKFAGYTAGSRNYTERVYFLEGHSFTNEQHFGGEGLLMHTRTTTVSRRGERRGDKDETLFIEELQSDLHMAARDAGGFSEDFEGKMEGLRDELDRLNKEYANGAKPKRDALFARLFDAQERKRAAIDAENYSLAADIADEVATLRNAFDRFDENNPVTLEIRNVHIKILELQSKAAPDRAPLHKSHTEVLLKAELLRAANNGFKYLAWTTAEQQAERYHGAESRVANRVEWEPTDDGIGIGFIRAYNVNNNEIMKYRITSDLETVDLFDGKRKKLTALVNGGIVGQVKDHPGEYFVSTGKQVVGAQGFVVQYDTEIPSVMQKIVKRYGIKVEKDVDIGLPSHTPGGPLAWRIEINDALRNALEHELPAYSLSSSRNAGTDAKIAEAKAVVDGIASRWSGAPKIHTVADESALPEHIRDQILSVGAEGQVEGLFDPTTGAVYIVAGNVGARRGESMDDAIERVVAEEVLGHHGLRATFGKPALDNLFDQVWKSFSKDAAMASIVEEYASAYGDPRKSKAAARKMADEFLAKSNPKTQPGLWDMLVSWAREHLRKIGLVRDWTNNDIQNLMERVFDGVRSGHIPSGLKALNTALMTSEGNDSVTSTVSDGNGIRATAYSLTDGSRKITSDLFSAEITVGQIDGEPALELSSFSGNLLKLAFYASEEGRTRIVAPASVLSSDFAKFSGLEAETRGSSTIVSIPPRLAEIAMRNRQPSFSMRYRATGSPEVEAVLAKTLQPPTSDLSWGQQSAKWLREMTGVFSSSDTFMELKTGWVDSAAAIDRIEREQFGGLLLDASESAYKMIELTRNLPQVMGAIARHGIPVYRDGQFVLQEGRKGLHEIFAPLWESENGENLSHLWEGYAIARRSSQLIAQKNRDGTSKEKLLSQKEIDTLLSLADAHPSFEKVFDDWQQFNREALDLAVDRGAMSAEEAEVWKQNDYVPFFRVAEEEETVAGITRKRGLSDQQVRSKRLTGSDKRIQPVIENIVMNTSAIIDKVYKNEAMRRVVALTDGIAMTKEPMKIMPLQLSDGELASKLGKAGLLVGDPSAPNPTVRAVNKALRDADVDDVRAVQRMTKEQKEHWSTFFRAMRPVGNNIVSVLEGGKPVYYRVTDPLVYRAVADMGATSFGGLVDLLGGAKNVLTTMITIDPGFMMANFMRDTLAAWTVSGGDFTPLKGIVKNSVEIWKGEGLANQLALAGGSTSGFYSITKGFGSVMDQVHAPKGATVVNGVKGTLKAYRKIGMESEQLNRVAIARGVMERGGSLAEAAWQAQDLTNFSRHGDAVAAQLIFRTVPFINARIQGQYRLWRAIRGTDKTARNKAAAGFFIRAGVLAAVSMALALRNTGNERYEELPDDQKDTYWHVFVGDSHFAIPKPFEVGVFAATIPERIMRAVAGLDNSKTFLESMKRQFLDVLSYNPIPQGVKPLIEDWANKDSFTGQPIVNASLDGLEPAQQYSPWTSETAIGIAGVVDQVVPDFLKKTVVPDALQSPVRMEHMIRAYFGTVGTYLLNVSDEVARAAGAFPSAPAMRDARDIPVVGRVLSRFSRGGPDEARRTKYTIELYDMLKESDDAYRTVSALVRQGNLKEAEALQNKRLGPLSVRPLLHKVSTMLRENNTRQRMILNSRELTPEQKREALDELTKARNQVMREAWPVLKLNQD